MDEACERYSADYLDKVFASAYDRFENSEFKIDFSLDGERTKLERLYAAKLNLRFDLEESEVFYFSKRSGLEMIFELKTSNKNINESHQSLKYMLMYCIIFFVGSNVFPRPFIISSERTGAATFRRELDFARNRLLKTIAHGDRRIDTISSLLQKGYQDYPLPIEQNVEFTRNLEKIVKQRSFISNLYPEVLNEFADMIGGDYKVNGEDILSYVPHKNKKLKLSLTESSSAIR